MQIEVIHRDYRVEQIESNLLDELIESGKIIAFRRSSGLVLIGMDPVRNKDDQYWGPDRRNRADRVLNV